MSMFSEFKTFIARGNVMDMAVGIIMGAAFTTIVKSLVSDVIMPPIGLITGGVDFTNLFINLGDGEFESLKAAQEAGAATINYGVFLNAVISFLIVAFVVFLLVKQVNRLKDAMEKEEEEKEEAPAEPGAEEQLLTEIRDLLKAQAESGK
ncbi:MAG: large conductance mechanosensitive channel protein MscL [Alphaproteobacteria bacterium]